MSTLSSLLDYGIEFEFEFEFEFEKLKPSVIFQNEESVVFNPQNPPQEPVSSHSGSYNAHPPPSLRPNRKSFKTLAPGSVEDERKFRRMISNQESARRLRMRKQRHLENLRNQVSRLKEENRGLLNRVTLAVQQEQLIRWENERLRSEAAEIRQRLLNVRQVLAVRQHVNPSAWPCSNVTSINGQSPQLSIIT